MSFRKAACADPQFMLEPALILVAQSTPSTSATPPGHFACRGAMQGSGFELDKTVYSIATVWRLACHDVERTMGAKPATLA